VCARPRPPRMQRPPSPLPVADPRQQARAGGGPMGLRCSDSPGPRGASRAGSAARGLGGGGGAQGSAGTERRGRGEEEERAALLAPLLRRAARQGPLLPARTHPRGPRQTPVKSALPPHAAAPRGGGRGDAAAAAGACPRSSSAARPLPPSSQAIAALPVGRPRGGVHAWRRRGSSGGGRRRSAPMSADAVDARPGPPASCCRRWLRPSPPGRGRR